MKVAVTRFLARHFASTRRRARSRYRRTSRGPAANSSTRSRSCVHGWHAGGNAIYVADGGDFCLHGSLCVACAWPLVLARSGAFGTLGVGGIRVGSALARPKHPVWIIWGDGACGYGLAEFDTLFATAFPSLLWWATTPAGRKSHANRSRCWATMGNGIGADGLSRGRGGLRRGGIEIRRPKIFDRVSRERLAQRWAVRQCWSMSGSTRPRFAKGRSRCR